MGKDQDFKRAILSVMFMFIILLSYRPVKEEISALALNETTDNAIISFMDSWFGLFWAFLAIFFIAMALYYLISGI